MLRCGFAYRARQDVRGGNATQTTFEYLSTTYRRDKYSNACCLVVFLAHRFCSASIFNMLAQRFPTRKSARSTNASANCPRGNDLNGIGMNSDRKWSPE